MAMPTSFKHDNNRPNVLIGTKVSFFIKFVCAFFILTIIFKVIFML
jgi:hypothetical protein